jgi:hypothetical protein
MLRSAFGKKAVFPKEERAGYTHLMLVRATRILWVLSERRPSFRRKSVLVSEGRRRTPKDAEGRRRTPKDAEGRRRTPKDAEGSQRKPSFYQKAATPPEVKLPEGSRRTCFFQNKFASSRRTPFLREDAEGRPSFGRTPKDALPSGGRPSFGRTPKDALPSGGSRRTCFFQNKFSKPPPRQR